MPLKEHKKIFVILVFFIIVKLALLGFYRIVWWDSSVYIGMGKYIYSSGNSGLWEDLRPVVWPFMLGFFWKMGINPVFFGRIFEIFLGAGTILITYFIGRMIFNSKVALLASGFLALSPTFFFFIGILLTEIVSTLFALVAIYFFIKKNYLISGIFFGISFMTRFVQVVAFFTALLIIIIWNKNKTKSVIKLFLGFSIIVLPYLTLNHVLYHNPVKPFLTYLMLNEMSFHQQISLATYTDGANYHGMTFYFSNLFKENFLYLFLIIPFASFMRNKNIDKKSIILFFLVFFVFFHLTKDKEMRYLISLFPYMYLIVGDSIIKVFRVFKINKKIMAIIILLPIIFSVINIYNYYKNEINKRDYKDVAEFLDASSIKIWTSNPSIIIFTNNKISNLMYYPLFGESKKNQLISTIQEPDYVFLDTCDLYCGVKYYSCEQNKKELVEQLKINFNLVYSSEYNLCKQFVFKK